MAHKDRGDIFDLRGIDRERGCLVVVRPDQYIANILPPDTFEEISEFFGRILPGVS
ncbi:phenol 2-monooxygenase [Phaeobacter sp. CECT 5382]|uniref:hypothetical protein n=1 Tax=Phaeobacter sp. CECT 5382 TaxID=1712645 RepID=UPI0006D9DDBD|nr:hypothetical protein [Phaeobacter sp. CECT 5382]CUH89942.1 phenol 2-monooxygenase [Phaeobacter sp. CECT 5382]